MKPILAVVVVALVLLGAAVAASADRPSDAGTQGNSHANEGNGHDESDGANDHGNPQASGGDNGDGGGNGNQPNQPNGAGEGQASQSESQASSSPAPSGEEPSEAQAAPGNGAGAEPANAQPQSNGNGGGQGNGNGNGEANEDGAPSSNGGSANAPSQADPIPGTPPGDAGQQQDASNGRGQSEAASGADITSEPPSMMTVLADHLASPVALAHAADSALSVQRGLNGNVLSWESPDAAAGQVQVWRRDAAGWTPITLANGEGTFTDATGTAISEYRLTWSPEVLDLEALATVSLSLAPGHASASAGAMGRWLLAILWGSIAVFGLVRNAGPRRVLDAQVSDGHELLPLLAGVPGLDLASLERVAARGLCTVGDLRRLDPAALSFWAQVPAATVRDWQQAIELLQWPTLPPGAGQRLALAGHASLERIAQVTPSELLATLRRHADVIGPGLPADEGEVASWVSEARQSLGLAPTTPGPSPATATV